MKEKPVQRGIRKAEERIEDLKERLKEVRSLLETKKREKPYSIITWTEIVKLEKERKKLSEELKRLRVLIHSIPSYASQIVEKRIKKKYRLSDEEAFFVKGQILKEAETRGRVLTDKVAVKRAKKKIQWFKDFLKSSKKRRRIRG